MLPVNKNLLPTVSRFFEDDWNNLFDWSSRKEKLNFSHPPVNIEDKPDHLLITMAVPGIDKKDIKVELNNNVLSFSAETEVVNNEKSNQEFSLKEFSYNRFHRSFSLNDANIDQDKIEANYKDGILSVRLEKKEEAKLKASRQIPIK